MYPTADDRWLAIGANGDGIFKRFTAAIGQPELADDPRFSSNQARRANVEALDALIAEWTRGADAGRGDGGAGRAPTCRPGRSTRSRTSPKTRSTRPARCWWTCRTLASGTC